MLKRSPLTFDVFYFIAFSYILYLFRFFRYIDFNPIRRNFRDFSQNLL